MGLEVSLTNAEVNEDNALEVTWKNTGNYAGSGYLRVDAEDDHIMRADHLLDVESSGEVVVDEQEAGNALIKVLNFYPGDTVTATFKRVEEDVDAPEYPYDYIVLGLEDIVGKVSVRHDKVTAIK